MFWVFFLEPLVVVFLWRILEAATYVERGNVGGGMGWCADGDVDV